MRKRSPARSTKRTSVTVSSKNTPRVEIQKHFVPHKLDNTRHGVEALAYIPETNGAESVKKKNVLKRKKQKRPATVAHPIVTGPASDALSLVSSSLDKKVESLSKQISNLERDLKCGLQSFSDFTEAKNNTPVASQFFESANSDLDEPILEPDLKNRKLSPDRHVKIITEPTKIAELLMRFTKPQISKNDPLYALRNEIAEYRKTLKKDVLPNKIRKILADSIAKNTVSQISDDEAKKRSAEKDNMESHVPAAR